MSTQRKYILEEIMLEAIRQWLVNFVNSLAEYYTWILGLAVRILDSIGLVALVLLIVVFIPIVAITIWYFAGKAEQAMRRIHASDRSMVVKIFLYAVLFLVYVFTAFAVEAAFLHAFYMELQMWFALVVVLIINAAAIAWHASRDEFWPAFFVPIARRLRFEREPIANGVANQDIEQFDAPGGNLTGHTFSNGDNVLVFATHRQGFLGRQTWLKVSETEDRWIPASSVSPA